MNRRRSRPSLIRKRFVQRTDRRAVIVNCFGNWHRVPETRHRSPTTRRRDYGSRNRIFGCGHHIFRAGHRDLGKRNAVLDIEGI